MAGFPEGSRIIKITIYYSMTIIQFPFPSSIKLGPQPEEARMQAPVPSSLYPSTQAAKTSMQVPLPSSLNPRTHGYVVNEQASPSFL